MTVSGDGTNNLTDYTWETLNENLSTLQFYNFGSHPTNPNQIVGGMQDNATAYWDGGSWQAWASGDGAIGAFDPQDPTIVYISSQYDLRRGLSTAPDDFNILFDKELGQGDKTPFITIFEIDPVESTTIYAASTTGIYRSIDRGDNWQGRLNQKPSDGEPSTISVSPQSSSTVWMGTETGEVYLFDGNQQYTRTGSNFPNRFVSKIEASPNDANTVYVTFSGYDLNSTGDEGNGNVGKVFKSTDKGMTWTDISGNLTQDNNLDVPVSSLTIDPNNENRIWIGTDTGTYQTLDGGTTWTSYRHNMPVVAVVALEYNANTKYLMVATHGRGIWRLLPDGETSNPTPTPTSQPSAAFSLYLPVVTK